MHHRFQFAEGALGDHHPVPCLEQGFWLGAIKQRAVLPEAFDDIVGYRFGHAIEGHHLGDAARGADDTPVALVVQTNEQVVRE